MDLDKINDALTALAADLGVALDDAALDDLTHVVANALSGEDS